MRTDYEFKEREGESSVIDYWARVHPGLCINRFTVTTNLLTFLSTFPEGLSDPDDCEFLGRGLFRVV